MNRDFEGVIILGSPRSGTTLLRRLIDAHPKIVCPAETNLLSSTSRFLEEADFAGGLSVGAIPGLGFSGFHEEEVLTRLREFLFGFWRDILTQSGKEIWAEKTAVDVFHIDAIERLCAGRCRYICISRHALDVVCSMKELSSKMDAYLPEIHSYIQRHASMSEAFAHAWCAANQRMLEFINDHPQWCIHLRYEDLVEDPTSEMNRIFEFLGVDTIASDFIEKALSGKELVGLGDWKTYESVKVTSQQVGRHAALDGWTVQKLAPIVNPLLARLGYPQARVSKQMSQHESRRTQELGRLVTAMKLTESSVSDTDA